ncbi:MAG: rffA [Schlesneria sp.]|nr:rffA [Schlesneria sp.]
MSQIIPLVRPYLSGREAEHVQQVLHSQKIASDGNYTKACAKLMEDRFGICKVLMTPSCTSALEVAALLCGLKPGDEVILPSYTFVSTANAVVLCGATPVFVDIRPDTMNLDESRIERAITSRTRAIMPVHYGGVSCDMQPIMAMAEQHGLVVIEDAAQGVNASYEGRALGSIGHLGCFSFHETKNFACGEGGALCVNDPALVERAEIIREKGTNRSRFLRGQVDKYTWVDIGGSHLPSELAMAFLYGQLEQMDEIQRVRRRICDRYFELLQPFADAGVLQLPVIPENCDSNYHMFKILTNTVETRDHLLSHLRSNGIGATFHYVPLHTSPMGQTFGYAAGDLPVTEELHARLIRLPLYCDMTVADQDRVVEVLHDYFPAVTKSTRVYPHVIKRAA